MEDLIFESDHKDVIFEGNLENVIFESDAEDLVFDIMQIDPTLPGGFEYGFEATT